MTTAGHPDRIAPSCRAMLAVGLAMIALGSCTGDSAPVAEPPSVTSTVTTSPSTTLTEVAETSPATTAEPPVSTTEADIIARPPVVPTVPLDCPPRATTMPEEAVSIGFLEGSGSTGVELFRFMDPRPFEQSANSDHVMADGTVLASNHFILYAVDHGQVISSVQMLGYAGEVLGGVDMDRDGRTEAAVFSGGATAHYAWLVHLVECEITAVSNADTEQPEEFLVYATGNSCLMAGCAVTNTCLVGENETTIENYEIQPKVSSFVADDADTPVDMSVLVTHTSYRLVDGKLQGELVSTTEFASMEAVPPEQRINDVRLRCEP